MELLKSDMVWILRRMPKDLRELMKERGKQIVLAGGFIRACIANEKPSDIDLFTQSRELAELFATKLADNRGIITTDNAFTVPRRLSLQFIHRWVFESGIDAITSFDFTIAKAAVWYDEGWHSVCDERFYPDLAAKRLVYCSPKRIEEVGGSMLRVLKFYQRGYRIPLDSLAAVIARVTTGIRFEETTDEQSWAKVMGGLLREVDPLIDPENLSNLPSADEEQASEAEE